ncbi:hypothetical protein A2U01_0024329, partial [Trifolium medium]|nr:hypothetical protein [Trifolium medium]
KTVGDGKEASFWKHIGSLAILSRFPRLFSPATSNDALAAMEYGWRWRRNSFVGEGIIGGDNLMVGDVHLRDQDRLSTKDSLIIGDLGNCGGRFCQWRFVGNSRGLELLEQFSGLVVGGRVFRV